MTPETHMEMNRKRTVTLNRGGCGSGLRPSQALRAPVKMAPIRKGAAEYPRFWVKDSELHPTEVLPWLES